MDNVKGTLLILTLLLAATTFVLFLQNASAGDRLEDAYALGANTRELLRALDVRCSAAPEQYAQLAECISPLLATDDFEQDAFRQPRDDRTGYLVIENAAERVYRSGEFTFYKNRELVQTGCTVPGDIGPDVTCRFDYPGECEDGDILEVFYPLDDEDVRVFLKTC